MSEAPTFFLPAIPGIAAPDAEAEYARLAKACGSPVPPIGQRIYSVSYVHDGERWTATVGERLKGTRHKIIRHRKTKTKTEYDIPLHDCAVVVAIFPGVPYRVVTDSCLTNGGGPSHWENPFLVGSPGVTYFSR